MTLMRRIRAGSALVAVAALSACAQIDYPNATDLLTNMDLAPDVNDVRSARAYVFTARENLIDSRSDLRGHEGLLDAGVAGGSLVGILGGALSWSSKTVIKATAVSGASYAGAQTLRPRAQLDIIDTSLAALDCISARAEAAYPGASTRALALQPVVEAKAKLAEDVENEALSPTGKAAGEGAMGLADSFINANQSPIFQQVRLGVDSVVTSTNTQMRKATADTTAVQKAFAGLSVASVPAPGVSAPQAAVPADGAAVVAAVGDRPSPEKIALDAVVADIEDLNDAMKASKTALDRLPPNSGVLDFKGCLPGAILLVVAPAGPISLAKSQSYELAVSGGQHAWSWSGNVPTEITVTQRSSNLYNLKAADVLTVSKTYTLVFTPFADGPQQMVSVSTVP